MSDQLERLDAVAEARGLSRSDVLRRLIAEASMTPEEREDLPDSDELLMLLAERARAGNVAVIRALLERAERDESKEPNPFDELDELQARYAERRAGLRPSDDLPEDWDALP